NAGFNGEDSFTYELCDADGDCDMATVTILVGAVNDPPVAVDDIVETDEDTPLVVDVLENDSDPDSELSDPDVIDDPAHGTIGEVGESTIEYIPDENFVGVDSFSYAICDGGVPDLCDTAWVYVNVLPVTDTLYVDIPGDSTYTVCGDTLTIFSDPAMDIALCDDDPANGEVSIDGVCVTYTPDEGFGGEEILCVIVCHPDDLSLCDTILILITVNLGTIGTHDDHTVDDDTPLNAEVSENDIPNVVVLHVRSLVGPNGGSVHGTVTMNTDGTFAYTPETNYNGPD